MKRPLNLAIILSLLVVTVSAQQTVTIGDITTKNSAVLYLKGNGSQGLIIPIVTNRTNITSPGAEKGMVVFDDSDKSLYYHDGTQWVKVGGGTSAGLNLTAGQNISITGTAPNLTINAIGLDAIVGNEVTQVNTARGGLEITGAGTAVSPLTVGLIQGTTNGQVLKWNSSTSKWELGTDATGGTSIILADGQILTGNGTTNAATALSGDATLSGGTLTLATGAVNSSKITDFTIANVDVATNAGIAGTKISPNFGTQNIAAAAGTFSGNVGIRGLNYTWPAALGAGVLTSDAAGVLSWSPSSAGTVTSVGLTMPSIFTVTGSPVTTTGTLATTLNSQTAATVFAAPTAAAGAPTFRSLASTDIPSLDAAKISTGTFPLTRISGAGAGVRAILGSDNNTLSWVTGAPNQLLGTDGAGALQFVNKSSFGFSTVDVIPKGSATGFVASTLSDNGTTLKASNDNVTFILEDNVNNAFNSSYLSFGYNDGSYQEVGSIGKPGSGNYLEIASPNFIHFNTSFGARMAIDAAGNVGIGTTSPLSRLHVNGPGNFDIANTEGDFSVGNGTYRFKVGVAYAGGGAGDVYVGAQGGTSRLFLGGGSSITDFQTLTLSSGFVGVNNTAPSRMLDVNSNGNSYGISHIDGAIRTSTYNGTLSGGGVGGSIGTETNHPFYIYVANSGEKATFLPNGNVGIGTNAPVRRFEVANTMFETMRLSTSVAGPAIEFVGSSDDWMLSSWSGSFYFTNSTNDFVSRTDQYQFTTSSYFSSQDNVKSSGTASRRWTAVYAVNGTIQTSDLRLKKDIKPLSYGLKEVMSMKPVSYKWRDNSSADTKVGLIAQEVQQLVPEVVNNGEYLGMNYGELVPVLIKAIQEQQAQIDSLKQQLKERDTNHSASIEKLAADLEQIKRALGVEASNKK